jgi:hypothetical protein
MARILAKGSGPANEDFSVHISRAAKRGFFDLKHFRWQSGPDYTVVGPLYPLPVARQAPNRRPHGFIEPGISTGVDRRCLAPALSELTT